MPQRIQLKRTKGWRLPADTVVVSRPSKWGNPYFIAGSFTAKTAVEAFAQWLDATPSGLALRAAAKRELRGKHLACWCPPGEPCHADVLLEIANS